MNQTEANERFAMGHLGSGLFRCTVVWLLLSSAVGGVLRLLAADLVAAFELVGAQTPGFVTALIRLSAVVVAGCLCWFWFTATAVIVEAVRATRRAPAVRRHHASWPARACPAALRRWVLAACGVALVGGFAAPASATEAATLDGLPLPDRAVAWQADGCPARVPPPPRLPEPAFPASTPESAGSVRVVPGDTLWAIAAGRLAADASDADITAGWREIYAANRLAIGSDPDLIRPGLRLDVSDPRDGEES
jgi:hypothetical protein